MTTTPHIVRLIQAPVPLSNMALATGVDAEVLAAELIPAACAEHNLTYLPLSAEAIAGKREERAERLAAFLKSERARTAQLVAV